MFLCFCSIFFYSLFHWYFIVFSRGLLDSSGSSRKWKMGGDYSSLFLLRGVKERASGFKNVYTATTNTAFKDGDVSMQSHPPKSWYHHFRRVEDIDDIFLIFPRQIAHISLHWIQHPQGSPTNTWGLLINALAKWICILSVDVKLSTQELSSSWYTGTQQKKFMVDILPVPYSSLTSMNKWGGLWWPVCYSSNMYSKLKRNAPCAAATALWPNWQKS